MNLLLLNLKYFIYLNEFSYLNLIIMATTGMRYSKNYTGDYFSTAYKTNLYRSNQNLYSSSGSNYIFKERNSKLRWKEINNLDIDSMIRNNDLSPLEPYLENLIFCTIDDNDLQIVPEQSVLKLIKTLQYILEEFLRTQMKLEADNKQLELSYNQLLQDLSIRDNMLKEFKSEIKVLKKEKRNQEIVINSYKSVIDENKPIANQKSYYLCRHCSGKKFSSENALFEHNQRRHAYDVSRISNKTNNIDEKLEMMKTHFETYIKSFQNESYIRIFENQKNFESKLNDLRKDKKSEIYDIENNFRNTIIDLKEMLKNSQIGNTNTFEKSSKVNTGSVDKQYEETMNILKIQAKHMNEILTQMQKSQNEKIQAVAEQIVHFKDEIVGEIGKIKTSKKKDKKEKENKEENSANIGFMKMDSIDKTDSIEIIQNSKNKKIFNAGKIESDFSDNENQQSVIRVKQPKLITNASYSKKNHNDKETSKYDDISVPDTNPTEINDIKTESNDISIITKNTQINKIYEERKNIQESVNELSVSQESIIIHPEQPKIIKVGNRFVDKKLEELAQLFDNYALRDYEFYDGKPEYTTNM